MQFDKNSSHIEFDKEELDKEDLGKDFKPIESWQEEFEKGWNAFEIKGDVENGYAIHYYNGVVRPIGQEELAFYQDH